MLQLQHVLQHCQVIHIHSYIYKNLGTLLARQQLLLGPVEPGTLVLARVRFSTCVAVEV